jgi:Pectate lyase superfamily protein
MDRVTIYPGQIPLETDLLQTQRNVMSALGLFAQDLLGTGTQAAGFTCIPTSPASLGVQLTPGRLYSLQNVDGSAYSSLPIDSHQILKQGILLDAVTLSTPAPSTAGQSINYLIQVAYQDVDSAPVTLPYYNASNPTQAYYGPNNSAATQPTRRGGNVVAQAKAGTAATTGTQTTPTADAGFLGLFFVTVANGASTVTSGQISSLGISAGNGAALVGEETGITVQQHLRNELFAADLVGDGITDNTTKINTWLTRAAAGNRRLRFPVGSFVFNDTLAITSTIHLAGSGRDKTNLIFNNAVSGKSAIKLSTGSIKSSFSDFTLLDGTFNTSCGIELTDSIAAGGNVQKNFFARIDISGFAIGQKYTSTVPLTGSGHAMCSETMWLHCRWSLNFLAILNQNCQAYNNRYIGCDIENFDTTYRGTAVVDSWDMISDEAGGGIFLEGGSYIGRGKVYKWKYPTGGSGLWSGATFCAQNLRMEARSTHNGVIINEEVHGVTGSLALNLDIKNIDITTSGQNLDFLRYGGRVNGRVENVFPTSGTGSLTVRQYPTLGRTSNTTTASQGGIELVDHTLFRVIETTSPYGGGGWAASATGRISSKGARSSSTNSSMSSEVVGGQTWFFLNGPGEAQQLGMQLNGLSSRSMMLWNNDLVTSGIGSDIYVKLPKGGRLLELIAFKHATQFATNTGVVLYMVKDNANWANPAAFAVGTDAVAVATMPSTAGAAGFYRIPCVLTSNVFGNELRCGAGSWTEGRMLLQHVGGATLFNGFLGVEYL